MKNRIIVSITALVMIVTVLFSITGALAAKDGTIKYLSGSNDYLLEQVDNLSAQLVEDEPAGPIELKEKGTFIIHYYHEHNLTLYQSVPKAGISVAVDPKVIPLGTYLYIEGVGIRVAVDTGAKVTGNTIDVFVSSKQEALSLGEFETKVYIVRCD